MSGVDMGRQMQEELFKHPSIERYNSYSKKVFKDLSQCYTAAKGMHLYCCDNKECRTARTQYHACGNRHCPNCGAMKRDAWVDGQMSDLLPTSYYHMVFTLPHELNSLIMGNRTILFKLLFDASSYAILKISKDEKYLGATPGIISILHTWGQDMSFHPHVHCIVSGGGIKHDETWQEERRKNHRFMFPKAVLQKVYKGYFMEQLKQFISKGQLKINDVDEVYHTIREIGFKRWNVYAKAPFGGPEQVIQYLGRYTHKIAITKHRIESIDEQTTTFKYRDYADSNKEKRMRLTHEEFMRRFEQHILPKGFVKMRYYGYLKNYDKNKRIDRILEKMQLPKRRPKLYVPVQIRMLEKYGKDIRKCEHCKEGKMILVACYRPNSSDKMEIVSHEMERMDHQNHSPP